jgi:GntR family transcriptional regulator
MMIDRTQSLPLYAQVEAALAAEIERGALPVGAQLPTEDQLIERFAVSRITVRTAIRHLVQRGLVEIHRGRGTFVAQAKIHQDLTALRGFAEDMAAVGRTASSRLIAHVTIPADPLIAAKLRLDEGSEVVRITRVRLSDDQPISLDITYLPREIGLRVLQHDLATNPIFPLLEEQFGIPLKEADYYLDAIAASDEVATELQVAPGSPIFRIERTTYNDRDEPIDFELLHYRGDLMRFALKLARTRITAPEER